MTRVCLLASISFAALVVAGAVPHAAAAESRITLGRFRLPTDAEISAAKQGPHYLFIDGHRVLGEVSATFEDDTLVVAGRTIHYPPDAGDSPGASPGIGELTALQFKSARQHERTVGLRGDEFYVSGPVVDVPPSAMSRVSMLDRELRGPGPVVLVLSSIGSCVFRGDAALDAIDQIAASGAIARIGPARPGAGARAPLGPLLREIESVQARP
jgi:hypothetical protein